MESIAIWYKPKDSEQEQTELELHINLWKLPIKGKITKFSRFLDLGLKIKDIENIEEIFVYFPMSLDENNICELGAEIVENKTLLNTIFNEDYSIKSSPNSNYHSIYNETGENVFNIYVLDDKISVEKKYNGSLIKIKLSNKKNRKPNTYIRIRISGDFLSNFSSIEKPSNSFFQSAFSKVEIVDLRVNEARALDNKLLEDIADNKKFKLIKLHFFFICGSKEDYIFGHQPFISCRKLEKDIWEKYINKNNDISLKNGNTILAYHWKVKDNENYIPDYNALIKTKYKKNDIMSILSYLIGLFVISFLISLGISGVKNIINVNNDNTIILDSVSIKEVRINNISVDSVYNSSDSIFKNKK